MSVKDFAVFIVVCCTFAFNSVLAQDGSAESKSQASESAASPRMNLDFSGGTAAQFVEQVRKSAGETNIVSVAELQSVAMPPVKLRAVQPFFALKLLEHLPRAQGLDRMVAIHVINTGGMIVIGADVSHRSDIPQDSLVISVGDVLEGNLKSADVLTAVETALQMFKTTADPADIKFHEATGLIIARGTGEQMSAIQQVIEQLRDRRQRALQQTRFSMETAIADLQTRVNALSEQLADASRRATEFQTRNEILEMELRRLRDQLTKPQ